MCQFDVDSYWLLPLTNKRKLSIPNSKTNNFRPSPYYLFLKHLI